MKITSRKVEVKLCKKLQKMFDDGKPLSAINNYVYKLVYLAYDQQHIDYEDFNQWERLHNCGEIFKNELKDWYSTFMLDVGAFVPIEEGEKCEDLT